jgi:hypothetical protein
MAYRVEVGPQADVQLAELDPAVGAAIERKIIWLAENAAAMIHRRLVGMPDDADTRVSHYHDPAQRKDRASCHAFLMVRKSDKFEGLFKSGDSNGEIRYGNHLIASSTKILPEIAGRSSRKSLGNRNNPSSCPVD